MVGTGIRCNQNTASGSVFGGVLYSFDPTKMTKEKTLSKIYFCEPIRTSPSFVSSTCFARSNGFIGI
jgi:hypothetical protein